MSEQGKRPDEVPSRGGGAWPGKLVPKPDGLARPMDAKLLDLGELARRAFGSPLRAGVFLQLKRGPWSPSRLGLYTELPWLQRVPEGEKVVEALLARGWAVLKLDSPEEAAKLCKEAKLRMVRMTRLGDVPGGS